MVIMTQVTSKGGKQTKEKFLEFIESKKLRLTSQRMTIIDVVFSTEEHFTAEQLLEWSRAKDPSISRATVYRTLPLLTESGLVQEMDFGKDYKYYDPNYGEHPNHHHIICEDCDRIVEFESKKIDRLEDEITQKLGFEMRSQNLRITANCESLKKHGSCKQKHSCR
jgi:Fur family ferric uptake transcriptional regulator